MNILLTPVVFILSVIIWGGLDGFGYLSLFPDWSNPDTDIASDMAAAYTGFPIWTLTLWAITRVIMAATRGNETDLIARCGRWGLFLVCFVPVWGQWSHPSVPIPANPPPLLYHLYETGFYFFCGVVLLAAWVVLSRRQQRRWASVRLATSDGSVWPPAPKKDGD